MCAYSIVHVVELKVLAFWIDFIYVFFKGNNKKGIKMKQNER